MSQQKQQIRSNPPKRKTIRDFFAQILNGIFKHVLKVKKNIHQNKKTCSCLNKSREGASTNLHMYQPKINPPEFPTISPQANGIPESPEKKPMKSRKEDFWSSRMPPRTPQDGPTWLGSYSAGVGKCPMTWDYWTSPEKVAI